MRYSNIRFAPVKASKHPFFSSEMISVVKYTQLSYVIPAVSSSRKIIHLADLNSPLLILYRRIAVYTLLSLLTRERAEILAAAMRALIALLTSFSNHPL